MTFQQLKTWWNTSTKEEKRLKFKSCPYGEETMNKQWDKLSRYEKDSIIIRTD